jgi:hypothetical protein
VQWFALAYALTAMVTIAAVGILLTLKPGRRLGLNLMWAIAAMPCVTLVQVRCGALINYVFACVCGAGGRMCHGGSMVAGTGWLVWPDQAVL